MAATTFDPNAKVNHNLTSGNLVATSTGAGGARVTRPLTGKSYGECTITTLTGTPAVGFAQSAWNNTTALQSGTITLGYIPSGAVQINGVTLLTIAAYVAGNRIGWAIDPANQLVWFRVNGGNWNNDVIANQNPVGDVGGINYGTLVNGTLFAAISASLTGNVWTGVFTPAFVDAVPTGYSSVDTVGYTLARNFDVGYAVNPVSAQYLGPAARSMPSPQCRYQRAWSPAAAQTVISGVVKELGVVQPNKLVEVYDRDSGELLGRTFSDGSGAYSIPCLGRSKVRIVASDPTTYNSLAWDNVTPG